MFYSVLCFSHDVITPPHPPSVNNNETFNATPSSNQATSSSIQHHPTHFTWRYYTPPHPPSVNNNETFNVTPSSNQATSSRIQHHPTHFTWRYYTPPPPPISIQERPLWYRIKTEGSSKLRGTPSLEPIYIYISHPIFGPDPRKDPRIGCCFVSLAGPTLSTSKSEGFL